MAPRIPTEADFAALSACLPHTLHFPTPRESTTVVLLLLHGLGDSEAPFARFARAVDLPGVLAVALRGTAPLPEALLLHDGDGAGAAAGAAHHHWGDDLRLDARTGDIDADPGFEGAASRIMDDLMRGVLADCCSWHADDVLLLGFGQGGSLALGLAARAGARGEVFKGVVSIGGPLPASMVPPAAAPASTKVLLCQLDHDQVGAVRDCFRDVDAVRWRKSDVAMPRDRDEMFPIIKFLADRLRSL